MRADVAAAGFRLSGYLVQPMVSRGVEIHVGVGNDGPLGPLVACAAGGVTAELIDDVSVRLAPLEEGAAGLRKRAAGLEKAAEDVGGAPMKKQRARIESLKEARPSKCCSHAMLGQHTCHFSAVFGSHKISNLVG